MLKGLKALAACIVAIGVTLSAGDVAIAASPKLGWAGSNVNHVNGSNASWYYNWWHTRPAGIEDSNAEWIPLIKYTNNLQTKLDLVASYSDVDTLLMLNEPERESQSDVSVSEAISIWPQVQTSLPNHTLVSPGVSDDAGGQAWLADFMGQVDALNSNGNPNDDLRVDAIAFHWYGGSTPNNPVGAANNFLNRVEHYHTTYNRPVWITEFAMHDWAGNYTDAEMQEANRIFLETVIPALESRSYVHSYSFYQHFSDAELLSGNDPVTPTTIGDVYVNSTFTGEVFDLQGQSVGTDVRYLRGGTIHNPGPSLEVAMRGLDSLELGGNVGGPNDWAVGGENSFVRIRSSASLAKNDANSVTWDNAEIYNDGPLAVNAGTLSIVDGNVNGSGAMVVESNARLQLISTVDRGRYAVSGQNISLAGALDGNVWLQGGSTLTTVGSAATATGQLLLENSTLIVGGDGFSEFVPPPAPVSQGIDLEFNAALDAPGDVLWQNEAGGAGVAFSAPASPSAVAPTNFPSITAAYSIPEIGGAEGLNGYFELSGPRSRRDASFEVVFQVESDAAGNDQVIFEAGGASRGVAFLLNGDELLFNVDGDDGDINLTQQLGVGWHHAVGVIDLDSNGDSVSLYVNGALVDSIASRDIDDWAGGNIAGIGDVASSVSGASGTPSEFHSDIALVRYYNNVSLSSSQVTQNYQAIAATPSPTGSVFAVGDDLTLLPGSVIKLDIGDSGASDRIQVARNLGINGATFEVAFVGNGELTVGDRFNLIDFATATGAPSAIVIPQIDSDLMWHTSELTSTGEVFISIAGDFNNDGSVDAADYTVWRDQLGATVLTSADANGDGNVDGLDYDIWRQNFGRSTTTFGNQSNTSIPEPSAIITLGLAVMLASATFRRRIARIAP